MFCYDAACFSLPLVCRHQLSGRIACMWCKEAACCYDVLWSAHVDDINTVDKFDETHWRNTYQREPSPLGKMPSPVSVRVSLGSVWLCLESVLASMSPLDIKSLAVCVSVGSSVCVSVCLSIGYT